MNSTITTTTSARLAVDPRPQFAGALNTATAVIAAVRADQWALPTPCPELDVRAMVVHLVDVGRRIADLGAGGSGFGFQSSEGLDDADLLRAWLDVRYDIDQHWSDDAVLERVMTLPWATQPGARMLGYYTAEVTVHAWDLAVATGQDVNWDDDVVELAIAESAGFMAPSDRLGHFADVVATMPPAVAAGVRMPFQDPVAVAPAAAPIDQLVAWFGRTPR